MFWIYFYFLKCAILSSSEFIIDASCRCWRVNNKISLTSFLICDFFTKWNFLFFLFRSHELCTKPRRRRRLSRNIPTTRKFWPFFVGLCFNRVHEVFDLIFSFLMSDHFSELVVILPRTRKELFLCFECYILTLATLISLMSLTYEVIKQYFWLGFRPYFDNAFSFGCRFIEISNLIW